MMRDTIAATATAPGRAGVAIVRVSGPDAFKVLKRLASIEPEHGRARLARLRNAKGGILDEALCLPFVSPRSYTGEDVVEFHCHGGSIAPCRVLEACFEAGARLARRGEFTERAYLNGKIDYEGAEAVLDLVNARTSAAADDALSRLDGRRRAALAELYREALDLSAEMEHSLDVDDSDLMEEFVSSCKSSYDALAKGVDRAADEARRGRLMQDGALVVIAGPPNAGKSSLLNALLGEDRAIVSATPGTTRDSIDGWIDLGGYPVRLADTAGIREAEGEIEREGVRRARDLAAAADVVLALDADIPGALKVHSKCDISRGDGLNVSSKTGEGLDELRDAIAARVSVLQPRTDCRAIDSLMAAKEALERGRDWRDMVVPANSVRTCADILGRIAGATYSADMLDMLFSRFCVGK